MLESFSQSGSNNKFCLQHDAESLIGSAIAVYGYGKYRIDFWMEDTLDSYYPEGPARVPDSYCTIDIDADYGIGGSPWYDLGIKWYNENEIRYNIGSACPNTLLPPDRNIQVWNPCPSHTRIRNAGDFKYDAGTTQTPNPYSVLPQDPRILCISSFLPGVPYQNHFFDQNYVGVLTLNLTIVKNNANGNPVEITTPTSAPFSYPPPINIAGYDPVQQKGATLTLAKGTNNQERVLRFKKYSAANYGTNLLIGPKSILELSSSTGYADRAHIIVESYCNTEVEAYGILLMRSNSMITLTGNSFMRLMPNAWLTQHSGSDIEIRDNATLMNCGAKFFVLAPIYHLYNNGRYIISNTCPFASIEPYISEVDSGGSITLSDNSVLTIEAYNKIIFDGSESYLKAEPGTTIEFGEGTSIEFKNGAYLDADGCTFTNLNSGDIWSGIKLNGAGSQSVIKNCTFNNAATAIDIENSQCSISDNQINVPENFTGAAGITATNVTNIILLHNTINIGYNATAAADFQSALQFSCDFAT